MLERFLYTLIPLLGWRFGSRLGPVAQTRTLTRAIHSQSTATLFKDPYVDRLPAKAILRSAVFKVHRNRTRRVLACSSFDRTASLTFAAPASLSGLQLKTRPAPNNKGFLTPRSNRCILTSRDPKPFSAQRPILCATNSITPINHPKPEIPLASELLTTVINSFNYRQKRRG